MGDSPTGSKPLGLIIDSGGATGVWDVPDLTPTRDPKTESGSCIHVLQTLTGTCNSNLGIGLLPWEHLSQNIWPQCL